MAYQFESLQSSLPPTISAGWNDPPTLTTAAVPQNTTNRLKQMRTRPVDPSITGPAHGYGHHGYGGQAQNPYGAFGYAQQTQGCPQGAPQGYGQQQQTANVAAQGYPQSNQYPTGQFSPSAVTQQPGMQQQQQQFFPPGGQVQQTAQLSPTLTQPPQQYSQPVQTPYQQPMAVAPPALMPQQVQQPSPTLAQQGYNVQMVPQPVQQNQYSPQAVSQQYALPQGGMQQPVAPSHMLVGQQPSSAYPLQAPPSHLQQQPYPPHSQGTNVAYYPTADPSQQPSSQGAMPSVQHRSIYDAFVVTNGTQPVMKSEEVFPPRPQTSAPTPAGHAAWSQSVPGEMTRTSSLGTSTPPVLTQPIESDPQSLIFAPPNTVPTNLEFDPHQSHGHRGLVKPAGDVSLSGAQLVAFLYKASTRLPPAKCEGVQLRLQHLNDCVNQGRLSEACLHKLNYLVDAIDRGLFAEAVVYFEQLQAQFPQELGYWGPGVRLLVNELRGNTRVGSAGAYIRNQ